MKRHLANISFVNEISVIESAENTLHYSWTFADGTLHGIPAQTVAGSIFVQCGYTRDDQTGDLVAFTQRYIGPEEIIIDTYNFQTTSICTEFSRPISVLIEVDG